VTTYNISSQSRITLNTVVIVLLLFFFCWWNTNKYTETHIYYEVLNSNSSEDIRCNNIVICSWIKTHVP
jgi:hypothetical protein